MFGDGFVCLCMVKLEIGLNCLCDDVDLCYVVCCFDCL